MNTTVVRTRSINEASKLRILSPIAQTSDELTFTRDYVILYRDGTAVIIMVKASDPCSDDDLIEMSERMHFRNTFQTWGQWTEYIRRRDAFGQDV